MRVPNTERAVVDPVKIRDDGLSSKHPVGRFKAAFFRTLGYEEAGWRSFEQDLRRHLARGDAETAPNEFGTKFVVRGSLTGPSGRTAKLISVWIVLTGEDFPRFVTAYPGDA